MDLNPIRAGIVKRPEDYKWSSLGSHIQTGNKERKKKYKVRRVDRFMYRTRYFTDAGIIGSKEFVGEVFDQVKHLLRSKDERKITPVGGVEGVCFMKRLGTS